MQGHQLCDPKLSASSTFGWLLYGIGAGVVRKHCGFATFPIIARGSLWVPVALVQVISVILPFAFYALVPQTRLHSFCAV